MKQCHLIDAALKAVGVVMLIKGISLLVTVPFSYEAAASVITVSPILYVGSSLLYALIHAIAGFVLLYRTDLLISRLTKAGDDCPENSVAVTYPQAIQLLGLFFTVSGLVEFIGNAELIFGAESTWVVGASLWYPPVVKLFFGLIMFTQSIKLSILFQKNNENA
ncbi:hypothetical protein A3194_05750 [Candidatus Thiodiazotropha endoloripes]|uniref:hypothetical protein n=1 Tax=Candidatus Thiodiazotropha endoloripes TaxID=1818881 RepID=UPI00083CCF62|nr:hypothetical protein [Candidatus Thiodiazotropha endoloripes]ODB94154.1 hypothetical protein A3194_05750 [Candidatus Thiodiazotropha endoloripes]